MPAKLRRCGSFGRRASVTEVNVRPSWQQKERDRISLQKMFGMPPGKALVWLPTEEIPRAARGMPAATPDHGDATDRPSHRR